MKPMMAGISGGLNPKTQDAHLDVFGINAIMLDGTSINRHPMGVNTGTTTLVQVTEDFYAKITYFNGMKSFIH